jgi:hypothetical protein
MKPVLLIFAVLSGLSVWFAPQWPSRLECRGKVLPIATLPGPKMTMAEPALPLRFGGTRPPPLPPVNGFPSETGFRLVIRTQADWADFWKRFTARIPPDNGIPPVPEIDFSKDMIVVSAMGERPHSGYITFIDGACEVDGRIEVFVSNFENNNLCIGAFMSVTQPADAVRIPRSDLPVVFRETQISCAEWKKFMRS